MAVPMPPPAAPVTSATRRCSARPSGPAWSDKAVAPRDELGLHVVRLVLPPRRPGLLLAVEVLLDQRHDFTGCLPRHHNDSVAVGADEVAGIDQCVPTDHGHVHRAVLAADRV